MDKKRDNANSAASTLRGLQGDMASKAGKDVSVQYHQIHLDTPSGHRVLMNFIPHGVRTEPETGRVFASANLFGRIYKIRMQDKMPAWRVCKENGEYDLVVFPEAQPIYDKLAKVKKQTTCVKEEFLCPPYSWGEE